MTRPTGRNWCIFGLCAVLLSVAMIWLTVVMLRLDAERAVARAQTEHQIAMNKALWRMDSWLAPQLAREAARPYFEYQPYYAQAKAYTRILSEIQPGEVLTPSPLLTFKSEIFPLHFQFDADGNISSPQAPVGNWRDLSQAGGVDSATLDARARQLEKLRKRVRLTKLQLPSCYTIAAANIQVPEDKARQGDMQDYYSRARGTDQAKQITASQKGWKTTPIVELGQVQVGPLLPIWIGGGPDDQPWLLFMRQVRLQDKTLYQGMLSDWPAMRAALLDEIEGLFAGTKIDLVPYEDPDVSGGSQMLATVPARLSAELQPGDRRLGRATLLVLAVAWGGLLVSMIAVGFALQSTIRFGQRRARFASAVTHELRTPLTTFRMYSEMLAENMVSDPEQRTEYLNTLKGEADRLSRLVENVLSYARIEDGRFNTHPERIGLGALLERIGPILEQRCRETGQLLEVSVHNGVELEVDVDAIAQILFNLVDNACKYASGSEDPHIEVVARAGPEGRLVTITVRDHGPGIPAKFRGAIFRPFERAEEKPGDNEAPGVGLGLALALALAEDLGGKLVLEGEVAPGAAFTLTIPTAPRVS